MVKFLHLGDIHIGYRQYKLAERENDFFKAFLNVCEKGAIEEQVDFVLVAGDLFNYRSISPQSFNEAVFVFNKLKKAGIPVIAIEGNHDFKEVGNFNNLKGSWFEALAQSQLIYFLYPHNENLPLEPLIQNKKYLGGSYIDLECGGQSSEQKKTIRVIGSKWHGFNAGATLYKYKERIQELKENNQTNPDFQVFMFHGGHENYLPVNRGGVSSNDFFCLQNEVDYIALGHIHEHYVIQDPEGKDFIFNSGSSEANSIAEVGIERGGLITTINEDNSFSYKLFKDYYQRKFIKLPPINSSKFSTFDELIQETKLLVQKEVSDYFHQASQGAEQEAKPNHKPIVQIVFSGNANYEKSNEEISELKAFVEDLGALYCIVKWDVEAKEKVYLQENNNPSITRKEKERSLLQSILASDESLANEAKAEEFSGEMLEIKELVIDRQSEAKEILSVLSEQ